MKRLAALICIAWILVCAGNALPCFAAGARVGQEVTQASCCEPTDTDTAPPEPTCPCCPQLRPAVLVMIHPLAVPTEYHAPVMWPLDDQHEPPDPREILHVPKLKPSLG